MTRLLLIALLIAACDDRGVTRRCGDCVEHCDPFVVSSCKPNEHWTGRVVCVCDVTQKVGAK